MSSIRLFPFTACAVLAAGILLPGMVSAHSEFPTPTWCSRGKIVEVGSFQILPSHLQQLQQADQCPAPNSGPILKDCGQFDDDYAIAKKAAMTACSGYAGRPMGGSDAGTVIFNVMSPSAYNDANHHDTYSIDMGVTGICVRCDPVVVPPTPAPVKPLPPASSSVR